MGSHYTDLGILAVWVAWFQKRSHYVLQKRCMEWADIIPLSPIINKNIYKAESDVRIATMSTLLPRLSGPKHSPCFP